MADEASPATPEVSAAHLQARREETGGIARVLPERTVLGPTGRILSPLR